MDNITIYKESEIIKLFSELVEDEKERIDVYSRLSNAMSYIGIIKLYHETDDEEYHSEAKRQKSVLTDSIDVITFRDLDDLEEKLVLNWDHEKSVKEQISANYEFSQDEIKDYIYRKTECSLYYSTIADLGDGCKMIMHNRQALVELTDGINDYESQPDVLMMYFLNRGVKEFPQDNRTALDLVHELDIDKDIMQFGRWLSRMYIKGRIETEIRKQYRLLNEALGKISK